MMVSELKCFEKLKHFNQNPLISNVTFYDTNHISTTYISGSPYENCKRHDHPPIPSFPLLNHINQYIIYTPYAPRRSLPTETLIIGKIAYIKVFYITYA